MMDEPLKKEVDCQAIETKTLFFLSVNKTMEYNDDGIELNHDNKEYS